MKLSNIIAPSFYEVHKAIKEHKYTHYWLKGGRGSTKSSFIAIEIVQGIMRDAQEGNHTNALVIRKVKDTLKESVFEQIVWAIEALGVTHLWNIPEAMLTLTYLPTGQKILFRGADKPKKTKSTKLSKGYFKYIWYEELDEFNGMAEIRMINQSLMRGGKEFNVFYSYNPPQSASNWVNAEAKFTRQDRLTHHSTYLEVDPEWLGEQFILEAEELKKSNLSSYEHEYLGKVTGTGGEVFANVDCRPIPDNEIKEFTCIRRGIDFGFAVDPFAYVVTAYDRKHKKLYIYHEVYKVGLSNYAAYEEIIKENKANETIIADSAEPKSISELNQYGLRVTAVKKGPDSVDYGIKFLQSLSEIVIDDTKCPNIALEFTTYELEKDANGNFKAGYPDKNNHAIDAVRYALNYECMQFKDQRKLSDKEQLQQKRYNKMVEDMTGGSVPSEFFTY